MKRSLALVMIVLPLLGIGCGDDPCFSAAPDGVSAYEVVFHQGDLLLNAESPFAQREGGEVVIDMPDWHVVVGGNILIDGSQISTVTFTVPPVVLGMEDAGGVKGGRINFLASKDEWRLLSVVLLNACPTDECGPDQPITPQDLRVARMKLTGEEFLSFWDSVQQLNRKPQPENVCHPIH